MLKHSLLAASLLLAAFACKKKDDPAPAAAITITSPTADASIDQGDSVIIDGTINAPANLHGYEITVINTDTDSILFKKEVHAHGTAIRFHEGFVNRVTSHTAVDLKVEAQLDHNGNYIERRLAFHLHPPE